MTRVTAIVTLACTILPTVAAAQTAPAPTPPPAESPPLHLFQTGPPISTTDWLSLHGADLWKPPVSGSELPRWTIGRTATLRGPRGVTFSPGFSVRRGDPMPLYLSQPLLAQTFPASLMIGPGSYRTQWDMTFRATAPIATVGRVKFKAFGEVIIPVTNSDPANVPTPFLNSSTIRFGIIALF